MEFIMDCFMQDNFSVAYYSAMDQLQSELHPNDDGCMELWILCYGA